MNTSANCTRSLIIICLCCGLWAFGFGLECPLASRWLQDAGFSTSFIGLNTAMHFLGVVCIGPFASVAMRRLGRNGILAGLLLSGIGVALFPWGGGPIGLSLLRFIAGAGGGLAMISLETLINLNAPPNRRARDFAFYACAVAIGFAAGSFAGLHLFELFPKQCFLLGGGVTLAAVPLLPLLPKLLPYSLSLKNLPPLRPPFLSFGSSWSQGFLEAGMLALLPLYLNAIGMSDRASGSLIGGILIGVLICQVPIGGLADRFGRERVLLGCFVMVAIGVAVVPSTSNSINRLVWLFVIGVCSGAFYPLGLAILGERLPAAQLPQANAWYLSMNCLGSLVSPLISGPIMERYGPRAMFWTGEAVVVGVLLAWLLVRLGRWPRFRIRVGKANSSVFK